MMKKGNEKSRSTFSLNSQHQIVAHVCFLTMPYQRCQIHFGNFTSLCAPLEADNYN